MRDLSVLIAARNEEFLARTVEGVLKNRRGNTEVIAICDGDWPNPAIKDHPDVILVHHAESIGQRAAINEAARLSKAKFIMKLDAHCIVDEGFDVKLMKDCEYDWTVIPRLYNLHAFNWKCKKCGSTWYQGPTPKYCKKGENTRNEACDAKTGFERVMVWKPRLSRRSDFMRFDSDMKFQYWGAFVKRPAGKGDIADTMSNLGACWFMHRKRYWDMDGLDEKHGSWGQVGTEISCKTWLSGGRQVVNKKTWYSHMFRTQGGDFGFPYPIGGSQTSKARKYSQDLWKNNKWPKAKYTLEWLIDKFAPVPGWPYKKKGIIYYTDNQLSLKIAHACKKQIIKIGLPIFSSSLKPMPGMGKNIHLPLKRGYLTYFKQILAALEASDCEIIFFCEHDWLYHYTHFEFVPPKKDVYYYNDNWWRLRVSDGHSVHYEAKLLPAICAYKNILLEHYKKALKMIEKGVSVHRIGFEPGTHNREERPTHYKAEVWTSKYPNIDIRHSANLTKSKWKKEDFRSQRNCKGWVENDIEIPGWGKNKDLVKLLT